MDSYLDIFDSQEKAIDHAMWLNFKYRIAGIVFGVLHGTSRNFAVCEEATAREMELVFLDIHQETIPIYLTLTLMILNVIGNRFHIGRVSVEQYQQWMVNYFATSFTTKYLLTELFAMNLRYEDLIKITVGVGLIKQERFG